MTHLDNSTTIPFGYCHCGCGRKTSLAKQTTTSRGNIQGLPVRFINGHGSAHLRVEIESPCPSEFMYIPLTKGQFTKVDTADYEWLKQWKWCAVWDRNSKSYRAARNQTIDGAERSVIMARLICGLERGDGKQADHENQDTLDNRRSNLRVSSRSQNTANRKGWGSSGYKGVIKGSINSWQARIRVNGKLIALGSYPSPEQAHAAYCEAAANMFGEFMRSNHRNSSRRA